MPIIVQPASVAQIEAKQSSQCKPSCASVFSDLLVYPLIDGGTKIAWELHPTFRDPLPHTFQLQYSDRGSAADNDSWLSVGSTFNDVSVLVDPLHRLYGKFPNACYRVKLTTVNGLYYSKPAQIDGYMPFKSRRLAKAIIREELLRFRRSPAGSVGYLLKRKHSGPVCDCVDEMERTVGNPDCLTCYGTGFIGGYYQPVDCFYVEFLIPTAERSRVDEQRGTTEDGMERGRTLNIPQLFSRDIWVCRDTDLRYSIEQFVTCVELNGVTLVLQPVELRRMPFSHVIYKFTIDLQQRL